MNGILTHWYWTGTVWALSLVIIAACCWRAGCSCAGFTLQVTPSTTGVSCHMFKWLRLHAAVWMRESLWHSHLVLMWPLTPICAFCLVTIKSSWHSIDSLDLDLAVQGINNNDFFWPCRFTWPKLLWINNFKIRNCVRYLSVINFLFLFFGCTSVVRSQVCDVLWRIMCP